MIPGMTTHVASGLRRQVVHHDPMLIGIGSFLALASLAAALPTLLYPDFLNGPEAMIGSARGTALIVSLVAVPLLLAGIWGVTRRRSWAVMAWLGATMYLLYNAVLFLFATPFNPFFLAYLAMLGAAVWTTVMLVSRTDAEAFDAQLETLPGRGISIYVFVVVVANALLWLRSVIPGLTEEYPPAFLDGSGLTTNPVFVQDLAIWLPAATVFAWWLRRGRPWGSVATSGMLVFWVIESIGIAVDQWFGAVADPDSPMVAMSMVPVFFGLAAVSAVPVWLFLRELLGRGPVRPGRVVTTSGVRRELTRH